MGALGAAGTRDKGSRAGEAGESPTEHNGQGDSSSLVPPCAGSPGAKWHVAATSSWGDGGQQGPSSQAASPNQCPGVAAGLRRGILVGEGCIDGGLGRGSWQSPRRGMLEAVGPQAWLELRTWGTGGGGFAAAGAQSQGGRGHRAGAWLAGEGSAIGGI